MKAANKTKARVPLPDPHSALLVVDVQVDFCPGGALAVPKGHEVVSVLNAYARWFHDQGLPVLASRDWHPPNHCSFREQGGPWPVHCVHMSAGAQFHPDLRLPPGTVVVSKATNPKQDAYSAFEGTTLEDRLREHGIQTLYVGGLATDYCVKHSVLDARRLGFRVVLLTDAIRGIEAAPGDVNRALDAMRRAGTMTATVREFGLSSLGA
ncbi:MAG: bifunctional nicotinamidase/pyrazinamidase [Nitrospirales bacterium]